MPIPLAVLLPLLAQVGPSGTQMQAPLDMPRRKTAVAAPAAAALPAPAGTRLSDCLALAQSDSAAAIAQATAWQMQVKGSPRAQPSRCLGLALTQQGRWTEAQAAFLDAREYTPANEREDRARLASMAANAALAGGDADHALALLDTAHGEAQAAADTRLAAEIALDRARALVALKRDAEAGAALAEARTGASDNATAWLLSATLLRRQGKLADAQRMIEQAATLAPLDPSIGLEAGVIAVLGGRDDAARRSWQSVLSAAPDSDEAKVAKGYLDQIGPAPASSGR